MLWMIELMISKGESMGALKYKIGKFINDENYRFVYLAGKGFYNYLDDISYLKRIYKAKTGRSLDLENPTSFNEKMQWLKLYDRRPEYTVMVDKLAVKEYVAKIIGREYIIPTIAEWESAEEIDWNLLPNQFVLKATHDSGGLVICTDKKTLNIRDAKKKLRHSLNRDYYRLYREWPYKNVPRKILAEEYMGNLGSAEGLTDYKLMCFNGVVRCSFTGTNRFSNYGLNVTFFDREWQRLPFERKYPSDKNLIPKPQSYGLMIMLAEQIAHGIPFCRVDFYEINGKPYFGEVTFYPGTGLEEFSPQSWDEELGSWIQLPKHK